MSVWFKQPTLCCVSASKMPGGFGGVYGSNLSKQRTGEHAREGGSIICYATPYYHKPLFYIPFHSVVEAFEDQLLYINAKWEEVLFRAEPEAVFKVQNSYAGGRDPCISVIQLASKGGKNHCFFFGETVALPLFMSRAFNHDFYGDCNIRLLSVGSALKQRGREKREACRHNRSRMSFSQLRALSHFNTSLWLPLKERIYNMCADKMLPSCCFFPFSCWKKVISLLAQNPDLVLMTLKEQSVIEVNTKLCGERKIEEQKKKRTKVVYICITARRIHQRKFPLRLGL